VAQTEADGETRLSLKQGTNGIIKRIVLHAIGFDPGNSRLYLEKVYQMGYCTNLIKSSRDNC
jgi:hypothetical protein